jgi:hypothetical protein
MYMGQTEGQELGTTAIKPASQSARGLWNIKRAILVHESNLEPIYICKINFFLG